MTEEEFLKLPGIYERIKQDTARIEKMRARLYSPKGLDTRDKVQTSGGSNMLAETVIDLQQKLDAKVEAFNKLTAEAGLMISDNLEGDTALVMRLRYVDCFSWAEISAMLDISEPTLYRYRRVALEIIFKE